MPERVFRAGHLNVGIIDDKILELKEEIYIDPADIAEYAAYIFESGKKRHATEELKMALIREKSNIVMKEIFEGSLEGQNLQAVRELVDDLVKCILIKDAVLPELLTIKKLDYRVYVHSVNVAVLSLALGKLLGLEEETLRYLGMGAFLHDIGKRTLPKDILAGQGRLTNSEYRIYRMHVAEGVEFLESTWKVPAPAVKAVSQHHEVLSGKGYPRGLRGDSVNLFGRIVGIANSFDNLITPKLYKHALSPFEALRVLVAEKGNYDTRILSIFISMLGKGPDKSAGHKASGSSRGHSGPKNSSNEKALSSPHSREKISIPSC